MNTLRATGFIPVVFVLLPGTPLTYNEFMRFVETPVFTRAVVDHLDDEAYHTVQLALYIRPERGAVIPGSGGLRKLRWSRAGRGKSSGLRIIYFWEAASKTIYLLYLYPKSEREDLTAAQVRVLGRLVMEEFG